MATLNFPTAERDSLWNAEAIKLVGYWQRQEAIPWVRIHKLPVPGGAIVRLEGEIDAINADLDPLMELYEAEAVVVA